MVPADASQSVPMTTETERKSSTMGTRPSGGCDSLGVQRGIARWGPVLGPTPWTPWTPPWAIRRRFWGRVWEGLGIYDGHASSGC